MDDAGEEGVEVEHKRLRSALEFAVLMAAEGQKRKPPLQSPKELRPFFNKPRLPNSALGRLRRVIDADPAFRSGLAAGAVPELVDEIGRLWLEHRDGWEAEAAAIAERLDAEAQSGDHRAQLRRAEKRRDAAEQAAARTRVELLHRDEVIELQSAEIDELRADIAKATEVAGEMKTELTDVRVEIRHARDREAAAVKRADAAEESVAALRAELQRQEAPVDPVGRVEKVVVTRQRIEIAAARARAQQLVDHLDDLLPDDGDGDGAGGAADRSSGATRRIPLALPGGVISSSAEAAEHLVRTGAAVLVDGYNVAKLGWPNRPLERQRDVLLDAVENLARRFGTDITVVFDGASIVGAHAGRRRDVRVVYSPEGITADDVIRDEVRRLPAERNVVVVTNDAEIVRDVRAAGANVVPSNALLAIT